MDLNILIEEIENDRDAFIEMLNLPNCGDEDYSTQDLINYYQNRASNNNAFDKEVNEVTHLEEGDVFNLTSIDIEVKNEDGELVLLAEDGDVPISDILDVVMCHTEELYEHCVELSNAQLEV